jgi:hypothetical protein
LHHTPRNTSAPLTIFAKHHSPSGHEREADTVRIESGWLHHYAKPIRIELPGLLHGLARIKRGLKFLFGHDKRVIRISRWPTGSNHVAHLEDRRRTYVVAASGLSSWY